MKEENRIEVLNQMNMRFYNRIETHLNDTCKDLVSEFEEIVIENEYNHELIDVYMLIKTNNSMELELHYECIRDGELINVQIDGLTQPDSISEELGLKTYEIIVGLLETEYDHVEMC